MADTPPDAGTNRPGRMLKLTLAYDGTPFVGWQRQADGISIQGLVEDALSRIEGRPVAVIGAGRTDAGVHACGQAASVRLTSAIDLAALRRALNAMLPPEIRVTHVQQVPSSFHARYSAESKAYRYQIVNGPNATPFEWRYAWHVPERLDVERMGGAALLFEGEHNFAAFRGTGGSVKTMVRRVYGSRFTRIAPAAGWAPWGCAIEDRSGAERLIYEVTADGFLRHMVRTIVGTLVEIGAGRRDPPSIEKALASGSRADAGPTAPACGLCLVSVKYGEAADSRQ
jgi:tRNA pseudouridine38-40 synthase